MQLDGPALRLLDELIGELGVFLVLRAERAGVCDVLIGFQRSSSQTGAVFVPERMRRDTVTASPSVPSSIGQ